VAKSRGFNRNSTTQKQSLVSTRTWPIDALHLATINDRNRCITAAQAGAATVGNGHYQSYDSGSRLKALTCRTRQSASGQANSLSDVRL
jgi:hypothetical protein